MNNQLMVLVFSVIKAQYQGYAVKLPQLKLEAGAQLLVLVAVIFFSFSFFLSWIFNIIIKFINSCLLSTYFEWGKCGMESNNIKWTNSEWYLYQWLSRISFKSLYSIWLYWELENYFWFMWWWFLLFSFSFISFWNSLFTCILWLFTLPCFKKKPKQKILMNALWELMTALP